MMHVNSIHKLRRGLVALAIALPVLYVLSTGVAIVQDYRSTLQQAKSDMQNIAATLNEHALRTFGEADARLRTTIAEIEREGLTPTRVSERRLHDILVETMRDSPLAGGIAVMNPDGWMVANGSRYPIAPMDQRDREYYRYLALEHRTSAFVSLPVRSRSSGRWTIPVTRRISHADGSLKMIVGFGVDMSYFDTFYGSLNLGKSARLMLMRQDGWVIMRTPFESDVVGRNLGAIDLFRLIRKQHSGAYETEHSVVDGMPRVVGYAALPGSALVATASVARDEVMQVWLQRSLQVAGLGALSLLALLCLLRMLWIRLSRLEVAQADLAGRNAELDVARRRFQELVDGIDGVVWEATYPDFRFTYVSGNAQSISGYDAAQWLAEPDFWRDRLCGTMEDRQFEPAPTVGAVKLRDPVEHHVMAPDGRSIWLRSNVMLAADSHGALQVRGITIDITGHKESEYQLFAAIHIDALTKLPSRRAFTDRIRHAVELARHHRFMVAVVLVDVDDFSMLNDGLGHKSGDEALVQLAARLQDCLGPGDSLARTGADVFGVLVDEVDHDALKVELLVERINASLRHKLAVDGRELYLTVSMGIALFPQDGLDEQALLRNADTALYRTKAAGRNGWQFFDSSMAHVLERRLDMETALRQAIEHEEFFLYYQPQRSLSDDRIVGAEALVRWDRPGVGRVPPQEFIRLAEENGIIVGLGNWIMGAACRQAVEWRNAGLHLRMAVNVSMIQLQQADFVQRVRLALEVSGLPPHCLELEITESALVSDTRDALDKLQQIRALGVELAVDDFGTGYSSLSYLKQMPVDRLKIDQSFVRDLPDDADNRAIVRAILAMAANLDLQVIAEGVESEPQLRFLREEGCQEIQGYLLSPPVSPENFTALMCAGAVPRRQGVAPHLH